MLARGGTATRTPEAFEERLDELGARLVSRYSPAFSIFGLSATRWELEESVDLFAEALHRPRFDDARLAALVNNLREGLARRNDDPLEVLEREWELLLYGADHPTTRPLTPQALQAIDAPALAAHHRVLWRPREIVVAISGDVDREEAIAVATRLVTPLDGSPTPSALPWPPPAPGSGVGPGPYRLVLPSDQAKVLVGHRLEEAAMRPESRWALAVVAEVLGGSGAVSRIQGRLRTAEGLVYRSSASLEIGDLWPGELRIFFETRPDRVERALTLVLEEIERIRQRRVPERELDVAKRNLLGTLRRSFDTADERAGYLAENALHGRSRSSTRRYARGIAAVDADAVLRAAREHLRPDRLVVLVLGPGPTGTDPLHRLLGRPVVRLPARDPATLEPLTAAPSSAGDQVQGGRDDVGGVGQEVGLQRR